MYKEESYMSTGKNIRAARQSKNISQKSLAKLAGINPTLLSQYETDRKKPKPETIAKIASALNLGYSYNTSSEAEFYDPVCFVLSDARDKLLLSLGYKVVWDEDDAFMGIQGHQRLYEVSDHDLELLETETQAFFAFRLKQLLDNSRIVGASKKPDKEKE